MKAIIKQGFVPVAVVIVIMIFSFSSCGKKAEEASQPMDSAVVEFPQDSAAVDYGDVEGPDDSQDKPKDTASDTTAGH